MAGTNGERPDEEQQTQLLQGWRNPAPTERIGGTSFSLWKVEDALPARPPRFSRKFYVTLLVGCFGLIAFGRWVADLVRGGNFLVGEIFVVGVVAAMYGGMLGAVILGRRKSKPIAAEPPPSDLPRDAIACRATVRHRGMNVGWLWFEGDRLFFRGAGFDFRLRREDFAIRENLFKAFRGGVAPPLNRPKGVTEYRLFLRPGSFSNGDFAPDPKGWAALEDRFAAWESGTFTSEASLFPPVRPVPAVRARIKWTSFVFPMLYLGGLLGFAGLILPIEPTNGNPPPSPLCLAAAGALLGLAWPLMLWSSGLASKTHDREADRAARHEQ